MSDRPTTGEFLVRYLEEEAERLRIKEQALNELLVKLRELSDSWRKEAKHESNPEAANWLLTCAAELDEMCKM